MWLKKNVRCFSKTCCEAVNIFIWNAKNVKYAWVLLETHLYFHAWLRFCDLFCIPHVLASIYIIRRNPPPYICIAYGSFCWYFKNHSAAQKVFFSLFSPSNNWLHWLLMLDNISFLVLCIIHLLNETFLNSFRRALHSSTKMQVWSVFQT